MVLSDEVGESSDFRGGGGRKLRCCFMLSATWGQGRLSLSSCGKGVGISSEGSRSNVFATVTDRARIVSLAEARPLFSPHQPYYMCQRIKACRMSDGKLSSTGSFPGEWSHSVGRVVIGELCVFGMVVTSSCGCVQQSRAMGLPASSTGLSLGFALRKNHVHANRRR